jgi:phosphate-selective porin
MQKQGTGTDPANDNHMHFPFKPFMLSSAKWSLLPVALLVAAHCAAQDVENADTIPPRSENQHSSKGFILATPDGKYELQLAARLQFRFTTPFDQDPLTYDDFSDQGTTAFKVNRARLKIGGHAYEPWLKYYFEYEMGRGNLLDLRVMVERYKGLSLKVGQWKTQYNRERMISSGEQQMVERSLINRPFTLDRQQGVEVYGHLDGSGMANVNYWLSALTGTGRGARDNDDRHLMYEARLQWNPLGRVVKLNGSDQERTPKPAALLAVGGATNRSRYTRFSQAGGGALEGLPDTDTSLYDVEQIMVETAFKYKGFSWQHESHWKHIDDRHGGGTRDLVGSYVQAGYFLHGSFPGIPKALELAARYAFHQPDSSVPGDLQNEYTAVVNWFFAAGHKNKLSVEYSLITFEQQDLARAEGSRVRLQWDISF